MSNIIYSDSLAATESCLGCASYFGCKDPHKSGAWVCSKFNAMESAHTDDLLTQMQTHIDLTSSIYTDFEDDQEEVGEFESMIDRALKDNRLVPLDLNVDDRDLPEAKNYYDWTFGEKGIKFRPFSRQLWVAAKLFGEMCPHCSNPDWYHNIEAVPVDYKGVDMPEHIQFLEHGVCPSCGRGRAEMWLAGDLNIYQEMAICLGQRSGKSIQTGGLASYHIHKLLKTTRPSEYYGLAASTTLTHTYTGLQYKRAYALLWTPIRDTIHDSPWFQDYHKLLKYHGERMGEELVTIKDTFINWRRSRFLASPSAPNVGTLRGDTRAGAGIDELGFFKFGAGAEDYVTISADEIHASLTNSLATVRTAANKMMRGGENNVQQGIMFNLSSPSSVFDKIMTLVRAAKNSRVLLGVKLPTWEVNPDITREDLQIYWDTDAVKAERDFGANPPLAASPFFGDKEAIDAAFVGLKNRISYEMIERTNPQSNMPERAAKINATRELPKMPPAIMTLDAGVSNNSFSLAISIPVAKGRVTPQPRQNSGGYERKPKRPMVDRPLDLNSESGENLRTQVLAILEVMPPKGGKINFNKMYKNVLVPLLKPFNVQVVVTDRWNSILLLDMLRDEHGVATFQYSLRYKDFEAIKSYTEGGRVQLPQYESRDLDEVLSFDQESYPTCFTDRPIDHMALQFLTVQDNGRTVDKGPNLTDDSFRAVSLAVHYLRNIDFVKEYLSGHAVNSGKGGGLVAMPGGDGGGQQNHHAMTGSSRGLVAQAGSGGEGGNTFSRSNR